jgi:hypothetical protein
MADSSWDELNSLWDIWLWWFSTASEEPTWTYPGFPGGSNFGRMEP